jgi:Holliday junction DNA helicase RuvA
VVFNLFAFLRGTVAAIENESLVIEVNGIGFQVQVPASAAKQLSGPGAEVKLHTHMDLRSDGVSLYGFFEQDELSIFRSLLSVSGVGPKAAIGLLSTLEAQKIYLAIIEEDLNKLTQAPGIGKKTAQRIILELKDKLIKKGFRGLEKERTSSSSREEEDAVEALVALGYSAIEARKLVRATPAETGSALPASELVRLALRKMGGRI